MGVLGSAHGGSAARVPVAVAAVSPSLRLAGVLLQPLLKLDAIRRCGCELQVVLEGHHGRVDRAKPALSVEKQGRVITVRSEGATYRFEPMTKALYDAHVKEQVELSPSFEDTGDLKRFYLRSFLGKETGE